MYPCSCIGPLIHLTSTLHVDKNNALSLLPHVYTRPNLFLPSFKHTDPRPCLEPISTAAPLPTLTQTPTTPDYSAPPQAGIWGWTEARPAARCLPSGHSLCLLLVQGLLQRAARPPAHVPALWQVRCEFSGRGVGEKAEGGRSDVTSQMCLMPDRVLGTLRDRDHKEMTRPFPTNLLVLPPLPCPVPPFPKACKPHAVQGETAGEQKLESPWKSPRPELPHT